MPRKPKRSRSHELETESRIAFEAALPSSWVFRPMVPDYGIDGSVEIFDERGEATGNQFLVQLKASDNWGKKRRLRLKRSTFDYLVEQPHPCIVVLYDAATEELQYQWLEGVPSYTINVSERSVSLPIKYFEAFNDVFAKIENELRLLRQLTNGQYSLPIGIRVEADKTGDTDIRYATAAEIVVKQSGGLLQLSTESYQGLSICIRVGQKTTLFQLSVRYHITGVSDDSAESVEEMADDMAKGILMLFVISQRFDLLNAFAQGFSGVRPLQSNRSIMLIVGISLCRNGYALTGIRILVGLIHDNCTADEIREIRTGLSGMRAERFAISFACSSLAAIHGSDSLSSDCSAEMDWLLGALHLQFSPRDSYRFYRKAMRGQPSFRGMPNFWVELAECQLQLERHSSAKRSFLISHSIEPYTDLLNGAGVAALAAGELTSAEKLFREAGQGRIRGIGRLRLLAIRIIRRFVGHDKANRDPEKANELLTPHSGTLIPEEVCNEVLTVDPLNAIAWRNLGMQHANGGDTRRAAELVLVAASLARDEGRYWAEAIFLMNSLGKQRLALQALYAGFWVKGPAFAGDFKEVAEKELGMPPIPPEDLKNLMDGGSFEHQHAHDQADRRYSSWLQKLNNRS